MKIITLIENLAYKKGLAAEHGLSLYIEGKHKKILFDTGQTGSFIRNAKELGIDIEDIDALIISHGHYDHTGGLYPFLEKNTKATVYAKKSLFTPKYHGQSRFIGELYKETPLSNRLVYLETITEIDNDIFIIPDIPIFNSLDTHFQNFFIKSGNEYFPDQFDDELFIVIKKDEKINIVTACSHRGITNMCTAAVEHFKCQVGLITGGFHMKECPDGQYKFISGYLQKLNPQAIGVCHCTGVDKYADMKKELNTKVFYNFTGNEVII